MAESLPRKVELNHSVLTNLLLLTITGLLIMLAEEGLELIGMLRDKLSSQRGNPEIEEHHED